MYNVITIEGAAYNEYSPEILKNIELSVIREMCEYEEATIILEYAESSFDFDAMLEDANSIKATLLAALEKFINLITQLTEKFKTMARSLVARNKEWAAKIRDRIKAHGAKKDDGFRYEIYPYWTKMSDLINYQIPEFQKTEEFTDLLSKPDEFRKKYFKDMYVQKNGELVYDPKLAFRGGKDEKISMTREMLLARADEMTQFIDNYEANSAKISNKNNGIIDILKRALSAIKRVVIHESSNLILDTINTLLEADEPATTSTVEKTDDVKAVDPKAEDKRENPDSEEVTSVKKEVSTKQQYAKLCYEVNAARMTVFEECYDTYVKALSVLGAPDKSQNQKK